ncbi:response regulator [Pontibacter pamirensis]|uniref:response regulator n=1 Tax=Pontibacter pamirensis TaxID=2562824 RepID=UPI00138A2725|nr:response regulator [Pontibacter pamirensis]
MKQVERVLVIDDDTTAVFLIKHVLNSIGINEHTQVAHNGVEGLARIREAAAQGRLPQLILLDIEMPEMNGFTFMEELAKLNLTDTRIVLLSSSQSRYDRDRATKSQAAAFLQKPLTKDKLRSII